MTKRNEMRTPRDTKDKATVFITEGGTMFTKADLDRFEIPQSKQLRKTPFGTEIIKPPYDLSKLMQWMEISVAHAAAIEAKVHDAVGIGWSLSKTEGEEDTEEVQTDPEWDKLNQFFNQVNDDEDITSVMKKVDIDYEGSGNAYIEVARDEDNKVNALFHVSSVTIVLHKNKDKYIQMVGNQKVYFKRFDDPRKLNRSTGEFLAEGKEIDIKLIANEIIPINQYSWRSHYYGVPDWLPAIFAMFGEQKEKDYNFNFFQNFGIPAYAVIFEGHDMDKDQKELVKKYFDTEVKGSPHKTMVFNTPQGGTIKFEALNVQSKDSSFRMYRRDNRDDILTAHRVPPYRAGIVTQGQLSGDVAAETDRIYLKSVIDPKQKQYEWIINKLIIEKGMEIKTWKFEFDDILIDDRKLTSEIDKEYFLIGVKTPNEIRVGLGLEKYEGGDKYYIDNIPIEFAGFTRPLSGGGEASVEGDDDATVEGEVEDDDKALFFTDKVRPSQQQIESDKLANSESKTIAKEFRREGKELLVFLNEANTLNRMREQAMIKSPEVFDKSKKEFQHYETINKITDDQLKDIDDFLTGWTQSVEPDKMSGILISLGEKGANIGGKGALKSIGVGLDFDLKNPLMLEKIERRGRAISGSIAQKTLKDFRRVLAVEFYEKGASIPQVTKSIEKLFNKTYKNRARTIARTETGVAVSETQHETYARNGVKSKRWLARLDSLTRASHGEVHFLTEINPIPFEEPFIVGGHTLQHPLDGGAPPEEVINCRCVELPLDVDAPAKGQEWTGDI